MKKIIPATAQLIPASARQVFAGQIFSVYQWEQQLFDGSTTIFEMARRPDTISVLVLRGDELLLITDEQPHRPSKITVPGGRTEESVDDSWLAAAQRELLEETGLTCRTWKLIDVRTITAKIEWFGVVYLAQDIVSVGEQQLDAGERIALAWQPYEMVRSRVLGAERLLPYLHDCFADYPTARDLRASEEFTGMAVDR